MGALGGSASRAGLFVLSYVLTETRGRWEAFVTALFEAAAPGALFLCAEPTNWQLLRLVEALGERLAASPRWLDVRTSAAPPSVVLLEKKRCH